jgi:hypothetical protein
MPVHYQRIINGGCMKHKLKEAVAHPAPGDGQLLHPCDCLLLVKPASHEAAGQEDDLFVPIPVELHRQVSTLLSSMLPSSSSFSLLLLHAAQLEPRQVVPPSAIIQKRQQYHAPAGVLEQILTSMRRVIRRTDAIAVQPDIAAALLLPSVDYQGISGILERVYHSISLLQAETLLPPLTYETAITLGIGTVAPATKSAEPLLLQAGRVARCVKLLAPPSVQPWKEPIPLYSSPSKRPTPSMTTQERSNERNNGRNGKARHAIPFMRLPAQVPDRLKALLPYQLAREWRCIPVGRNQQSLTVAMAEPSNAHTLHLLAEATSMTIFPVSCEVDALDLLLDEAW